LLTHPNTAMIVVIDARAVAPEMDCVALYMIWMWGCPVGVMMALSTSPRQKQKVTSMRKPKLLLTTAVQIMARGSVCEASFSSSDMWVAASAPRREKIGESCPTSTDRPTLPHPALSWNPPKTSLDGLRGPRTHMVMNMAKNPKMCRTKTIPSTSGSLRANSVLKRIENVATAITRRVPCHRSGM
jgi:hypothetical protein